MKQMVKQLTRYLIAGGVSAVALFWNGNIPTDSHLCVSAFRQSCNRVDFAALYADVAKRVIVKGR